MPDPAGQGWSPYVYCGNNPTNFIDPNGELFILDDMLIAMAIGATFNSIMNANNIHDFGDFMKYAGIGAASGAMGYAMAPGVFVGMSVGALEGAGYGALSGGILGGVTNSLNAGSIDAFGSGFVDGAVTGGILGGYSGYKLAKGMGHNPWTGAAPEFNYDPIAYESTIFDIGISSPDKTVLDADVNVRWAKEDLLLHNMENSQGLGNGSYKTKTGYGWGPKTKYPNPRNDCSLRVARTLGKSDNMTTRNAWKMLGSVPTTNNASRLQAVVWEGSHMGFTRNGLLYHMTPKGLKMGTSLQGMVNYIKKIDPVYYNINF